MAKGGGGARSFSIFSIFGLLNWVIVIAGGVAAYWAAFRYTGNVQHSAVAAAIGAVIAFVLRGMVKTLILVAAAAAGGYWYYTNYVAPAAPPAG